MTAHSWIVWCLAYLVGLLAINLVSPGSEPLTGQQWCSLLLGLGGLSLVGAIALANRLRLAHHVWLGAAIIGILAAGYFQLRLPQPSPGDISQQVTTVAGETVTVTGKVINEPRLNANHRLKFNLKVSQIGDRQPVSGKLYVSLPLLQGTGINPGETITLQGSLYLPQGNSNPGGFDFRQYLARQGIFSGMQGSQVISDSHGEPAWGWWKLRRRIVRSHLRGLGSPVGQLISSMVLGSKAVDLPQDLRDRFVEAGLAHVLAASGFHVSLLLGLILRLTSPLTLKSRFVVGIVTLMVYLGLTGIQASVLRACLMGSAVLFAMTKETKVKPLGLLLLVATLILLFNPLFIKDLGFQLSFLATFGLIVTMPGLQSKLDWLPPAIATLVAVPLAASIWVLPLLGYIFHRVPIYSLLVNIVCTPLIMVISLGGMISAIVALIIPLAGSAIAWLLLYPTLLLISIINFFTDLPQNSWAIGKMSLGILVGVYGLLLLAWLHRWWCRRWWLALLLIFAAILTPIVYQSEGLQINFLAARQSQIIVIQDRGEVIVINSGTANQAKYTVIPFLAQQGINQIDYGLALDTASNSIAEWLAINRHATIKNFNSAVYNLANLPRITTIGDQISTSSVNLSLNRQLGVINLQVKGLNYLILGQTPEQQESDRTREAIIQYVQQQNFKLQQPIIVWSGNQVPSIWLEILKPQIAIASSPRNDTILNPQLKIYNTAQEGTIYWTPQDQLQLVSQQPNLE